MSHLLAAAAGEPTMLQFLVQMAPMLLIFAVFYFIWFVPIRKKQKAHQEMIDKLEKGQKVVTNGGLFGEVARVEGQVVTLKLAENLKVRVSKQAIAGLQGTPAEHGE